MARRKAPDGMDRNAEIDQLRQTFTRVAVSSLVLLYFALAGVSTAMYRVNSDVVREKIATLKGIEHSTLEFSYVFSQQLAADPELPKTQLRRAPALVSEVAASLEALAKEWFSVRFELLGTTLTIDLRLVIPLIPFLAAIVFAYLSVIHRRIRGLEEATATTSAGGEGCTVAADILDSPEIRRHPSALLQFCLWVACVVLTLWLIYIYDSLRALISSAVQTDYANAFLCSLAYLTLYVSYITQLIRGPGAPKGWAHRLKALIARARVGFAPPTLRRPRGLLFSGAGLVLMTLVLSIATSCKSNPRPGWEYLLGKNDAMWFNGNDWWGALTDYAMRPLYGALVFASIIALVVSSLPWRNGATRWPWLKRKMLVLGASVSGSVVLLAMCSLGLFGVSEEVRFVGDVATLLVWAVASIWLWRSRGRAELHARRWEFIVLVMLPALATFGLQAARFATEAALVGLPMLILGGALQCRVYRFLSKENVRNGNGVIVRQSFAAGMADQAVKADS